jgi:hypothetical protein
MNSNRYWTGNDEKLNAALVSGRKDYLKIISNIVAELDNNKAKYKNIYNIQAYLILMNIETVVDRYAEHGPITIEELSDIVVKFVFNGILAK